ncbi:MAG TPA: peptidyl-prolyl cis-trans isomerase [Armatimonadota bacterium]|jgi:foldase protein PrsA
MKPTFGAALFATVILTAGCSPSKKDLATVNGQKITEEQVSAYMMQGPEAKNALKSLIQEAVLVDQAKKDNVKVTDEEVNQYLQAQRDQYPPSILDELYAKAGATPARVQREAKKDLLRIGLEMQGAKVSDESIKKIYDADQNGMFTKPEWVQIGVMVAKDRGDADKAISSIKEGVDFQIVHGKFTAPEAKGQPFNYIWLGIHKGEIVNDQRKPLTGLSPAIKSAILKTKAGSAAPPIGTPGRPGMSVIYVKTRVPGGKLPLEEVKPQIAYGIAVQNNQTKQDAYPELIRNAKIEIAADQFKDLSKPESLLPNPGGVPMQ